MILDSRRYSSIAIVEQESDDKEVSRKEDSVERKDEPVQVFSKQNECRGVESVMNSRP